MWCGGTFFVDGDQARWESRWLHRQVVLSGARLVEVRRCRIGGWFIRATEGHLRLAFDVGGRQYLLIVPADQAPWVAASIASSR